MTKSLLTKTAACLILFFFHSNLLAQDAGFNFTFLILDINNTGNTYFDLNASTANPDFNNVNLGSFCEGSSNAFVFKGAEHNVYKCNGCDLTSTSIYYRIFPTGSPSGTFTGTSIGYSSGFVNGCGGEDQQWTSSGSSTNLLAGLSPGNYTLEVYSSANTNCLGTVYASNGGSNYAATFTVYGQSTYYYDNDGDGFGNGSITQIACAAPANYVANNADCNDSQNQYQDLDGDSFGSNVKVGCGVLNATDCNDNQIQYLDADGDTFGSSQQVACGVTNNSDCNDNQIRYVDNDGDGFGSLITNACGVTNNIDCNDNQIQYLDSDGDGFGSLQAVACGVLNNSDCNDNQLQYLDFDGDSFGSTTQVACGVVNNVDCNDNQIQYLDSDGDGFGSSQVVACGILNNIDCNDNQLQYLDADGDSFGSDIEVACGVTNHVDCNDDQLQYLDSDGDGYGSSQVVACGVLNNSDCNDNQLQYMDFDGDSFGSTTQVACGVTNNIDCNDSQIQYLDSDGDTYGSNQSVACGVLNNIDCNDNQLRYVDADGDGFGSDITNACGVVNNIDCNDSEIQYLDSDGDGFGSNLAVACGVLNNSDCNDNQLQYLDFDGDSFGSTTQVACGVVNNVDCNDGQTQYLDADSDTFGSNIAVACGVINNIDCNDNQLQYLDADGDSFGSTTTVACGVVNNIDCDDNAFQYLDSDQDGFGSAIAVACGVLNNFDCNDNQLQYLDADGDSFGSLTEVACGVVNHTDCNDNQFEYFDADGDGFGSSTTVACGVTNNIDSNDGLLHYLDSDNDGYGGIINLPGGSILTNTDCDDNDQNIYQSVLLYIDMDGDGYDGGSEIVCYGDVMPFPYIAISSGEDCNDNNVNVNPSIVEVLDNGLDDDCDGMTDAYPPCSVSTTWNGAIWTNGYPMADQPAVITADYEVTADLFACSLTISSNAQVVVNEGFDLKISAAVNIEDGSSLLLKNNANLVQTEDVVNSGIITSTRQTAMRRLDYTYWSSPVFGQNLFGFSPLTSITPTSRFYTLNETTNQFVPVDAAVNDFIPAQGYSIRAPNNFTTDVAPFTGKFTGVPNNGLISIPVTVNGNGFNLIGNPYPSAVNASLFLTSNPGTLYFWTHRSLTIGGGANYASYNSMGGTASVMGGPTPNGTIQTGQGFLLHKSSAGNAVFTNEMRIGNNQGQFYRSANNVEKHRFWLNLSAGSTQMNQILVGYADDATDGFDEMYDGRQIYTSGSRLSTRIEASEYVIQGRALPFVTSDIVPLSFHADESAQFRITMSDFDGLFSGEQSVFLYDYDSSYIHDLKQGAYLFTSGSGSFENRFALGYENTTLGIDKNIDTPASTNVFVRDRSINLVCSEIIEAVSIFDIRGREVYSKQHLNSVEFLIDALRAEQQVLIVRIKDRNGNITTRKVVY